jgi:hypothetical protein
MDRSASQDFRSVLVSVRYWIYTVFDTETSGVSFFERVIRKPLLQHKSIVATSCCRISLTVSKRNIIAASRKKGQD